ncbi:MAG: efflux RND transporter permease subunit [Clostridium sp.]|nr:efflux RND transporter permease subunit [Acetatifactor muris]MCM1526100.1 efflux RND transporter permease subunit [Bacteroides sp.]MCM1564163.1 efflux RND transporter permease subunit [Clostridium sp.]
MSLTKLALKRPVSCMLAILALAVFGISSIFGFKLQLIPDIEMPMLIVMATYPGADPKSVDELVVSVIEDAGSSLSGVDSTTTMSYENYGMVLFTYEYGVDITECHDDLRAALEVAQLSLPDDAGEPTIIEMNVNSLPCMTLSATEVGDVDLLKVVNESVVPELESISGVAQVEVNGGSEEYIRIELNDTLMSQYGLTMSNISQFLTAVDFSYPAGSVSQGNQDISITTSMEYNTVQKLRNVPIMTGTGQVLTLQDVADVSMSTKEAETLSRYNGLDNLSISIQNKSSFGTVNVCRDVEKKLQRIQESVPAVDFRITYDASESIMDSLTAVFETLLLGVALTMLVLFLFFGDFKASLIVGSSMPISLFFTLLVMSFMGFSMNIVTLGSLVIAIGMMVDASIVVIESCFRRQKGELSIRQAVALGTQEVTASIIASTITTIVVYLPLALMEGLSGQLFSQLGMTIVVAMLSSLIAALMLVPLFFCVFKPVEKQDLPVDKILRKVTDFYRRHMPKLLHKKKTVLAVSVLLLVASFLIASLLDVEMIPAADEGMVAVTVNFRSGTSLEARDRVIREWEQIAAEHPDVSAYSVSVSNTGASMTATLRKGRSMTTAQVVDQWNELGAGMTNVDVTVASSGSSMSSMMSTGSFEIDLQGRSMEDLRVAAEMLSDGMRRIDGVVKVDNSLANISTLVQVDVDPLKAMQYGLTPITVGMTLNNVLSGVKALTITNDGSEYEVRLEYPEGQYDDLNQLMDLMLPTSAGINIPLRDIAQLNYVEGQESIARQNGLYYVSVTATLNSEKTFEAQDAINALVDEMTFPESVTPADSMMTDMMIEELTAILKAILIAVFLVFLVMAMQFESPRFSIMVMTCIPFALIGSFLLLFLTGQTLSMISLMGFLMLMGIVVNNGILFVDSTNMLRQEMPVEDALVESGCIRLRPILMTTLTTILSMLPLGIGIGANAVMMKGMALVIIGGLVASTVLTLILIPSFYLILDKKKKRRMAVEEE